MLKKRNFKDKRVGVDPRNFRYRGQNTLTKMTVEQASKFGGCPEEIPVFLEFRHMYGGDFHEDEMAGNVGNIYKKKRKHIGN
jgi:hypothetical protein